MIIGALGMVHRILEGWLTKIGIKEGFTTLQKLHLLCWGQQGVENPNSVKGFDLMNNKIKLVIQTKRQNNNNNNNQQLILINCNELYSNLSSAQ